MARKTIETLLDREQLLNMNNNFEELYTNVNNIKDKSNEIDNLKNELKDTIQKVEDTEIKDNSIDGSKIIDNSIEANKLAIFETNETSNLLDLTKIKKDTSLNTDGSIKSEQRYWLTDLIPFDASKNERLNITYGSYRIFTYDKNGNYIGPRAITQGDSLTIEPTSETKYIRISGAKSLSEVMINKGDALLPYEKPIQKGDIKLKDEYYNHFELENKSILSQHIDDKAIQTNNIDNGTVTPEKTSFFTMYSSTNLLDLSKVLENTSIDLSGNVITEEGRWLTDYIPLDASKGEQLNTTTGSYRVGNYDENKKPIGRRGITNDNKLIIENTSATKYVRVSGTKPLSEVMINKGDTLLPYEKNKGQSKPTIQQQHIPKISPDNCTHFEKSHNLFNRKTVLRNKKIDVDGSVIDQDKWVVSDKILANGSLVSFTTDFSVKWSVFDKNDKLILTGSKNSGRTDTLNLPNGASYFIVSVGETTLDRFMVNYGGESLPFEEFGYTLVSTNKTPITISSDIVPTQSGGGTVIQSGTIVNLENSKQISNEVSEVYLSNEERNIYSTTKTSQLDYVEISTNSIDAEIVLSYSDEENNTVLANTSVPGELEELPLTLQNIVEYGYPNVEYLYYDPKKASYKIALKNLNFSNGFELSIRNSGASTINITTKIVGRYYV